MRNKGFLDGRSVDWVVLRHLWNTCRKLMGKVKFLEML